METFASINATTTNKSDILTYSEEQGAKIVLPHSMFQDLFTTPEHTTLSLTRDLEDLKKRDTRLLWHSITLSEYWRVKRIPRGLRLKKIPSFGLDDPEFMQKWEKILNKCSLDLMLLTIEKTKMEREKTSTAIQQTEEKIKTQTNGDAEAILNKINSDLKQFQVELQNYKIQKYETVAKDYAEGRIYDWRNDVKRRPSRKPRTARQSRNRDRFSTSAREWESPHASDAENQQDTRAFLPNARPPQQRGRGGVRGGARGRPPKEPTRRSPRNQFGPPHRR